MTIAACYVSPEGIVLGADSTTTFGNATGPHFFNHAQKLFEIGENSTFGAVTWGLGGLNVSSYRTLFAKLADDLKATSPTSVLDVTKRWSTLFWAAYSTAGLIAPHIATCKALAARPAFNPDSAEQTAGARTMQEELQLLNLNSILTAGFCIGGYVLPDREPSAFLVVFEPTATSAPNPDRVPLGAYRFRGAPNMTQRLIDGYDENLRRALLTSGKWSGSDNDLDSILTQFKLNHPTVPLRDAVDFIHSCISSTIKAFKFSNLSQICGGPIEMAVISADRPFRWVRHKTWDSAILEGGL